MKSTTLGLILLTSGTIYSQTNNTSTGNGDWNSTGIWNTSGSGNPYNYFVRAGDTIDVNLNVSDINYMEVSGVLTFNSVNTRLTFDTASALIINSGGKITGGNSANRIIIGTNRMQGTFNESGPAYATTSTTGFTTGILPVELIDFTATYDEVSKSNLIQWRTASEENNSHFEIQRSTDIKNWSIVGIMNGQGTTQKISEYQFNDAAPNKINYYRIKQIDYDGNYTFSKVIEMHIKESIPFNISCYPSPAENILNVTVPDEMAIKIQILSLEGSVIIENDAELKHENTITIPVSQLETGLYLLKVMNGNGMVTRKFVKQ